ncbi:hypothetical protein BAE44_0019788, partial [Dichanthelium oligosanthes]
VKQKGIGINLDSIERSIAGFDVSLRFSSSTYLCSVLLFYCSLGLGMRTSLSGQAKLEKGSSQGGFTPLSRLTLGNHGWIRVRVRVSRIWVAFNPNTGTEFGLDSLLIDDEGVTMQARAFPSDMNWLKHQLVEGKVYALSHFTVVRRRQDYMACRNDLMIYMGKQTAVDEISDDAGSSIPLHSFEFVNFGDVPSRNKDKSLFTDVIGQIVSIEDEGRTWKWDSLRNISFRNIHLRDLRGRQLSVALYEDLGRNFDRDLASKQDQEVPIVAIFAGMFVQLYNGIGFTVRSTSASKYYLDLDIPEVQEFRKSLANAHKPIDRLPCHLQNPVNPAELVNSWRTIKQLTSLNPHELHGTWFLCRATLKGIDCTKGWSYQACFHCNQSISWDGIKPLCIQGCPNNMPPVERYKLDAVIEDETGAMNVMIFDDPAQKLIGVAAGNLFQEATGDGVSAIVSLQQKCAFVVAPGNGCFVVKHILNDDELQLLNSGSVHMEAGSGDELSQDEGSSSFYSSSPHVKKVEYDVPLFFSFRFETP